MWTAFTDAEYRISNKELRMTKCKETIRSRLFQRYCVMDPSTNTAEIWPTWVRWSVLALGTLILCSCRATIVLPDRSTRSTNQTASTNETILSTDNTVLSTDWPTAPTEKVPSESASTVSFEDDSITSNSVATAASFVRRRARSICPTCRPPAACFVEPPVADKPRRDEYLCDGGDLGVPAGVREDGSFAGLAPTETVGAYEKKDGCTLVQPSNRVCIYAPRFGAVRRVVNAVGHQRNALVDGVQADLSLARIGEQLQPTTTLQRIDPQANLAAAPASLLRNRQQGGEIDNEQRLAQMTGALLPYANLEIVRTGELANREKALLAEGTLAAITWSHDLGVQVAIEGRRAQAAIGDRQLSLLYRVEEPDCPKLRIIKLASRKSARPGEVVDFTLRFDNVGNQVMKNVTIVDNLTTRLVYVPGSAKSSREARFASVANQAGSFKLQWELTEPLPAGEGGVITFQCSVR